MRFSCSFGLLGRYALLGLFGVSIHERLSKLLYLAVVPYFCDDPL